MAKVVKDISTPSIAEPSALVTDNSALQATDDGSYTYLNATLPVSALGSPWTFVTRPVGPTSSPSADYELVNKKWVEDQLATLPFAGLAVHSFKANDVYSAGTNLDGSYFEIVGFTISYIALWRRKAGSSGDTIVDVNLNGVTLFTTQPNRPTLNFSTGDGAWTVAIPDIVAIPSTGVLTVDIDSVEGGNPEDLVVTIYRS